MNERYWVNYEQMVHKNKDGKIGMEFVLIDSKLQKVIAVKWVGINKLMTSEKKIIESIRKEFKKKIKKYEKGLVLK